MSFTLTSATGGGSGGGAVAVGSGGGGGAGGGGCGGGGGELLIWILREALNALPAASTKVNRSSRVLASARASIWRPRVVRRRRTSRFPGAGKLRAPASTVAGRATVAIPVERLAVAMARSLPRAGALKKKVAPFLRTSPSVPSRRSSRAARASPARTAPLIVFGHPPGRHRSPIAGAACSISRQSALSRSPRFGGSDPNVPGRVAPGGSDRAGSPLLCGDAPRPTSAEPFGASAATPATNASDARPTAAGVTTRRGLEPSPSR
jgi:hypothetical protein